MKGLLDQGADLNAVDKQKISALHFACGQGRLEVIQFLWSRGVELDAEDPGMQAVINQFQCCTTQKNPPPVCICWEIDMYAC